MKNFVEILLLGAALHLSAGVIFAALFHAAGLKALDTASDGSGLGFRLLITPGVVALWPLLALKWARHRRGETFLGDTEQPVTPRRLRAFHGLAFKLLAVVIPLAIAAALWWRPSDLPVNNLPVFPHSQR
jgi:hypothetical protein